MLKHEQFKDRKCLVVGSAPSVNLPIGYKFEGPVITANGGGDIARSAGLAIDTLVTTSFLFSRRGSKSEQATKVAMSGLRAKHILVDDTADGQICTAQVLLNYGINSTHLLDPVFMDPGLRNAVTEAVCGRPLRISTGMWCICLALYGGASSVVTAGIDFRYSSSGHYDMPWDDSRRDHVYEDNLCFNILVAKGHVIQC